MFNHQCHQLQCVHWAKCPTSTRFHNWQLVRTCILPSGLGDWWPPPWIHIFDLHGNHSPMAHHCILKEAHTILYIQQVSHEWIKGDEEETAYAQATKSLRVVRTNIQHRPRFYKGSKQPTSLWSKLYLILRTRKTMVN